MNPASIIEANVRHTLTIALQEGQTAIAEGNRALAEHYQMIAYLSGLILEAVDDVAAEIRDAAEK